MKYNVLLCLTYLTISGLSFAASPTFRVVPAYEGVARYLQALREEPDTAPLELFQKYVTKPYRACQLSPLPMSFLRPPNYLAEVRDVIETLRASGVEEVVKAALNKSAAHLRGPASVTVCLGILDPNDLFGKESMNGITGWAGQSIVLEFYPEPGWLDLLPYLVAHEYHHIVMFSRYLDTTRPLNLLEVLLLEGRADAFASELYPSVTAPWTQALSKEQERKQWAFIKPHLSSTAPNTVQRYFYGSDTTPWKGYTIGFHIMQAFLKRYPHMDVAAWSVAEAETILRESGYRP